MIRQSNQSPQIMEFTSFKKKDHITDDELLQSVLNFESAFLAKQEGVVFHCLVRNFNNEYANVMFLENQNALDGIMANVHESPEANQFFSIIENESVKMNFNQIMEDGFQVPEHFSCVEVGTFELNSGEEVDNLLKVSSSIENQYLNQFANTKAHFIGQLPNNVYSEITLGNTLGKTKEVCMGYLNNAHCKPLLEMCNSETMHLDFWYVIA